MFMDRVRAEVMKQTALVKVFRAMNEHMQFKDTTNLYVTLFQRADSGNDKRFSANQLRNILVDGIGMPLD